MKVIGIIAEYNPFHNGHKYLIEQIKSKYPESIIIVVMSGNFMQRGNPAIINKFKRTEVCLKENIDLVVELPFVFATQSADFFAKGAISILKELKIDTLVFGSEEDNLDNLMLLAKTQLEEEHFDLLVRSYIKDGFNYPTALSKALLDITGVSTTLPNDILGITYIKEILKQNASIEVEIVRRTNNYHDEKLDIFSNISSATSIRKALLERKDIDEQVPSTTLQYLSEVLHFQEDYFKFLKYKISLDEDLSIYHGIVEGIDHKIKKAIKISSSYDELISNVKSKRYTYNRINRILLYILVGFTKEKAKRMTEIEYIRVLGFNAVGKDYLNTIKKESNLPIISNFSSRLSEMLNFELQVSSIYASILNEEEKRKLTEEEFKHHP